MVSIRNTLIATYAMQLQLLFSAHITYSLVEEVTIHNKRYGLEPLPRFAERFPKSIKLGQTIATWKHIVHYQQEQERAH